MAPRAQQEPKNEPNQPHSAPCVVSRACANQPIPFETNDVIDMKTNPVSPWSRHSSRKLSWWNLSRVNFSAHCYGGFGFFLKDPLKIFLWHRARNKNPRTIQTSLTQRHALYLGRALPVLRFLKRPRFHQENFLDEMDLEKIFELSASACIINYPFF